VSECLHRPRPGCNYGGARAASVSRAQQNFVLPVHTTGGGVAHVWTGDRWMQAADGTKAHEPQSWLRLEFAGDALLPLRWSDTLELDMLLPQPDFPPPAKSAPTVSLAAPLKADDGPPGKRYMLLGTWYGGATAPFVDAGVRAGFNSVRVTADWGAMETAPGAIDWSVLDKQTAYVNDVAKLPLVFNIWCRRGGPDAVVPRSGLALDQFGNGSMNRGSTWSISFASEAAVGAALGFVEAVVARYSARYPGALLYYACFDGYSETEYFPGEPDGGYFDFAAPVRARFTRFLEAKYGTAAALNAAWGAQYASVAAARPPTDDRPTGQKYVDWYLLREMLLGEVVGCVRDTVHAVNPGLKVAVQWGSVYDGVIRLRGLINFPCLAAGVDAVWVDDAPSYPSCFAMDYLRSNLAAGTWLANEIDGPGVGNDTQYYAEAANSFNHGCSVLSVANWDTANLIKRSKSLFQRIASDFLHEPTASRATTETIRVNASVLFREGSAVTTYVPKYEEVSNDGATWVDLHLVNDLGDQPMCDEPVHAHSSSASLRPDDELLVRPGESTQGAGSVVAKEGDIVASPVSTASLHVDSKLGSDANDGSQARPFKTIQRCHDAASGAKARACEVLPGLYRETVEISSDVTIRGGGGVVVSGLEPLRGLKWAKTENKCIFRAPVDEGLAPIPQLFYGGEMMIEARWPNIELGNVGNSSMAKTAWRTVKNGSAYGRVVDPALRVPFSWEGGLATLNVAHQWDTWTRRVSAHDPVEGAFSYPQNLPGLAGYDPHLDPAQSRVFDGCRVQHAKCNQYWLSGKREALDAPGEWFHEPGALLFYPPSCAEPGEGVEYKARDYAFRQPAGSGVHLAAMSLKGATVRLENCTRCSLRNLTLSFPTYDREIRETRDATGAATGAVAKTLINGQHIALRDIVLTQSNNNGLTLSGFNVSLDNCLISYTDWLGTLMYQPLGVTGNQMRVTRCTVRDFGNAGVVAHLPNVPAAGPNETQRPPQPLAGRRLEVSHTHIFHGARVGEDTAALYSGGWAAAGQEWHHNWVHDTVRTVSGRLSALCVFL
jgi:hypothetical protein